MQHIARSPAYIMRGWWQMMMSPPTLTPRTRPALDWPKKAKASPRPKLQLLGLCGVLALLCALYFGPLQQDATAVVASQKVLPIYSVEREDKVISVTFDASWGGDKTMAILDLLDQYNAKATFFLVGIWVDKYPELVQEIAKRGHEIGNHSDSHAHFTQISDAQIRQELKDCSDKIEDLTGTRPTLFRPPYGDYNSKVITVVRDAGYEAVQWSIDSLDWKNRGVNDLVKRATTNVQKGDIILFHNDSQYIVEALPAILQHYQAQGFTMIPAKDILLSGNTTIDVQGKQHPAAGS